MQNELAGEAGFWAGFMSVRSNTSKLGNVSLVVEWLYTVLLLINREKLKNQLNTEIWTEWKGRVKQSAGWCTECMKKGRRQRQEVKKQMDSWLVRREAGGLSNLNLNLMNRFATFSSGAIKNSARPEISSYSLIIHHLCPFQTWPILPPLRRELWRNKSESPL